MKSSQTDKGEIIMVYYIADLHFGHKNVLRFDNRPFPDTENMDEYMIQCWNGRVTEDDTVYVLGDAFWKNEEGSVNIMHRLNGHKHLIKGNHDRVHGKLRFHWESIQDYAEINDNDRLVILSHFPIPFYKNQHYGAVMLYGHVHNTREWNLVEKWKHEQWNMGIPSRMINVGCMMDYIKYTPRTLDEILAQNPMPELTQDRHPPIIESINETIMQLNTITNIAFKQYETAVNDVIGGNITDESTIDRLLDSLLNFGELERFRELHRKLCEHVYYNYPQLVGNNKNLFRLQFERKEAQTEREET